MKTDSVTPQPLYPWAKDASTHFMGGGAPVWMSLMGEKLFSFAGFRIPLLPVHSLVTILTPLCIRVTHTLLPSALKTFLLSSVENTSGIFQNM
jgi:hypothetical protein